MDMPESEWRTFRELHTVALDRFCQHVLGELDSLLSATSRSHHDRYLAASQLMHEQNLRLASAFDNPRRSHALSQLAEMQALGLLRPEELARFSQHTRDAVDSIARRSGC